MNFSEIDVKRIIDEIQRNRAELKSAIDASEARIQLRVEECYGKIRELEAENSFLRNKVENLERQQNSNNVLLFGLNKTRSEISFDFLRDKLKSLMQIDLSMNQINNISCLGSQKNCPVKIEFVSNLTKKYLFANVKKLKGTGISVANDLTIQQRKDLLVLKRHHQAHKENNRKSFIRRNKLVVDGVEYTVDQLLEIEQKEDYTNRRINSLPSTPTQPLIREVFEDEPKKLVQPVVTEKERSVVTTPKAQERLKSAISQHKQNIHSNSEKVKTRSTSGKNKYHN